MRLSAYLASSANAGSYLPAAYCWRSSRAVVGVDVLQQIDDAQLPQFVRGVGTLELFQKRFELQHRTFDE